MINKLKKVLPISFTVAVVNIIIAFAWGSLNLDIPKDHELIPFVIMSGVMTLIFNILGVLVLILFQNKFSSNGTIIWRVIGIVFIIIWTSLPIFTGLLSETSLVLALITHSVAGIPALILYPDRIK